MSHRHGEDFSAQTHLSKKKTAPADDETKAKLAHHLDALSSYLGLDDLTNEDEEGSLLKLKFISTIFGFSKCSFFVLI